MLKGRNFPWIPFVTLTIMILVAVPPIRGDFNPAATIQDPTSQIYMDQLWYNFTSPPTMVGDTFYVDVIGYNISEVYAYQVVIDYDATLLSCLDAWPDGGGWTEPNWIFYDLQTWGVAWTSYADQPSAGRNAELVGDSLQNDGDEVSLTDPAGEALLARFEFEILVVPEPPEELSCVISITSSWAAGTFVQSVEEAFAFQKRSPDMTDSTYLNKWSEPLITIKVEPESYTATHIGETFTINVTINDLDASLRMNGVQFRLSYNNETLEALNVTEGPFLKQFPTPPNTPENGTLFTDFIETHETYGSHVLVGILLLPNGTGQYTVFPEGSGTLATISFNATAATPQYVLELFNTTLSILVDDDVQYLSPSLQHGSYQLIETLSHVIVWEDLPPFHVLTVSNGRVSYNHTISSGITFIQPQRVITFNVTATENITSFCNTTIPRELLDAPPNNWIILVGGETADYIATQNDTHTSLWFNITHTQSTLGVEVFGETVIPEFPIAIIPALFIALTLLGVALRKTVWSRKRGNLVAQPKSNT